MINDNKNIKISTMVLKRKLIIEYSGCPMVSSITTHVNYDSAIITQAKTTHVNNNSCHNDS
jgi:hypothetical protein